MRFRTKTILGVAAIEIAMLAILVGSVLNVLRASNEAELEQRVRLGSQLLAAAAKDSVISQDLATLASLTAEAKATGQLEYVRIEDATGRVLAEQGIREAIDRKNAQDSRTGGETPLHEWEAPITAGGIAYGRVLMSVSVGPLRQLLWSSQKWAAVIAFVEVALVAIFSWMLGTYLSRELVSLRKASDEVAGGNFSYRLQISGNDELTETARSFNRMAEQLGESQARLSRENKLRLASEELLRSAIDAVNEGFAIFDPQERLVYCNRKYRLAFPSLTDMLRPGVSFSDLLHEWAHRNLPHKSAKQNSQWIERRLVAFRDGDLWTAQEETGRWVQGIERRADTGHIVSFRVDITDLVEARERAEAASEAKTRFLATMSHELRTPLNGVLGMAQLLQGDKVSDAERVEFAQIIETSGQGLLRVINDILDLSTIETGKLELHWSELDPSQLLQDVAAVFREQAQDKGLEFKVQWDGLPGRRYRTDPQRVRRMLLNLMGNAVKFTERGSVRVCGREVPAVNNTTHMGPEEALLEFSVHDTGIGIAKDKLALLFQPFSQVDMSNTRRYGGTGLGLSIVQRLAGLMGGEVGVDSEPGRGSHFWVRIRAQVVASVDEEPAAVAAVRQPVQPLGTGGCVLVVEDHPINQTLLQAMLEKLGLDSVIAGDGRQAVDLFARGERFDVVLMDLQMPVLDGLQATREIRLLEAERPGKLHMPIIALTAKVQPEFRETCMAAGLDDVLHKPVDLERLGEVLQHWLARYRSLST